MSMAQHMRFMEKKTEVRREVLMKYFKARPDWDDAVKNTLSTELGMTVDQVESWNLQHRKRLPQNSSKRTKRTGAE